MSGAACDTLVTRSTAMRQPAITKKPSRIALRRPNRSPTYPAGKAPITPPTAQAMKPIVTSSGRTPKRSVPCSAHASGTATTRGVRETWDVVPLALADDVTVRTIFPSSGGRVTTQTYRTYIPC